MSYIKFVLNAPCLYTCLVFGLIFFLIQQKRFYWKNLEAEGGISNLYLFLSLTTLLNNNQTPLPSVMLLHFSVKKYWSTYERIKFRFSPLRWLLVLSKHFFLFVVTKRKMTLKVCFSLCLLLRLRIFYPRKLFRKYFKVRRFLFGLVSCLYVF